MEVRQRAGDRCEYCRISQRGQEARFHIDHVVPVSQAGETALNNLALACVSCSLHKGARTAGHDDDSGETVSLFNPRNERWAEHFIVSNTHEVVGVTPTGRVTVQLLRMNRALAVEIRREQRRLGWPEAAEPR